MHFNPNVVSLSRGVFQTLVILIIGSIPARAQLNFGFTGGVAGSVTGEGVADFSETKFSPSRTYGASAGYRFSNGLTLAARAEQFQMGLRENGASLGTLRMKPILFSVGYQGLPSEGRRITGHVQFGAGMALTDFEKGSVLTDMESAYGARLNILTSHAPIFEFGGGLDYFFSRYVSFTSDFRILFSNVGTQWSAVGYRTVEMPDIETFLASNGQAQVGIRFWLK